MQHQFSNRRCRSISAPANERGTILILVCSMLFVVLIVVGLAIDSGNLYRARIAMQSAADATAVATVNYITMEGKLNVEQRAGVAGQTDLQKKDGVTNLLRPQVEQLVRANMDRAGFPNDPSRGLGITITSEYLPSSLSASPGKSAYEFRVTVQRNVELLILWMLPNAAHNPNTVRVSASSRREVANVSLILDASESMGCPRTGECACHDSKRTGPCGIDNRRFDDLIDATTAFLKLFDLDNDNIMLTPFNFLAKSTLVTDYRDTVGPITSEEIDRVANAIKQLYPPRGPTNICDGLMEAQANMERVVPDEKISYLLFSDGAPTAGRFLFKNSVAKKAKLDKSNVGYGDYDYLSYTVEWVRDPDNVLQGQKDHWAGPSLLMSTEQMTSIANPLLYVFNRPDNPIRLNPKCHDGLTSAVPINGGSLQILKDAAEDTFGPCLSSLESQLPSLPERTYGSEYVEGDAAEPGFKNWREQYYHCAIELSDLIRERKGVMYVIGLGDADPGSTSTLEPYQNIDNNFYRKDILLSRVALDPVQGGAYKANKNGVMTRVEFAYTEYQGYEAAAEGLTEPFGIYLPTHDSSQLKLLFQQIARRVLLKLVS